MHNPNVKLQKIKTKGLKEDTELQNIPLAECINAVLKFVEDKTEEETAEAAEAAMAKVAEAATEEEEVKIATEAAAAAEAKYNRRLMQQAEILFQKITDDVTITPEDKVILIFVYKIANIIIKSSEVTESLIKGFNSIINKLIEIDGGFIYYPIMLPQGTKFLQEIYNNHKQQYIYLDDFIDPLTDLIKEAPHEPDTFDKINIFFQMLISEHKFKGQTNNHLDDQTTNSIIKILDKVDRYYLVQLKKLLTPEEFNKVLNLNEKFKELYKNRQEQFNLRLFKETLQHCQTTAITAPSATILEYKKTSNPTPLKPQGIKLQNIQVLNMNTLEAAQELHTKHPDKKILAMLFGNRFAHGGGCVEGKNGQEEDIMRCTNAYLISDENIKVRDEEKYKFNLLAHDAKVFPLEEKTINIKPVSNAAPISELEYDFLLDDKHRTGKISLEGIATNIHTEQELAKLLEQPEIKNKILKAIAKNGDLPTNHAPSLNYNQALITKGVKVIRNKEGILTPGQQFDIDLGNVPGFHLGSGKSMIFQGINDEKKVGQRPLHEQKLIKAFKKDLETDRPLEGDFPDLKETFTGLIQERIELFFQIKCAESTNLVLGAINCGIFAFSPPVPPCDKKQAEKWKKTKHPNWTVDCVKQAYIKAFNKAANNGWLNNIENICFAIPGDTNSYTYKAFDGLAKELNNELTLIKSTTKAHLPTDSKIPDIAPTFTDQESQTDPATREKTNFDTLKGTIEDMQCHSQAATFWEVKQHSNESLSADIIEKQSIIDTLEDTATSSKPAETHVASIENNAIKILEPTTSFLPNLIISLVRSDSIDTFCMDNFTHENINHIINYFEEQKISQDILRKILEKLDNQATPQNQYFLREINKLISSKSMPEIKITDSDTTGFRSPGHRRSSW